ncbi:hypothetical protein BDQ17DRAFT_1345832 [Cyathus striatus]|nr:hypothetical protein BDQ17DRAFT_1345832 [Cyathus striatus]
MTTKRESDLSLHPIIQRRRPCSPCKCLIWSGIVCTGLTAVICIIVVLFFIYSVALNAVSSLNSPSAWIHQNTTLEDVSDRSQVVRPLIDDGQLFDIVASVWIRHAPFRGFNKALPESLLFSDVVFRGVSAKDRGIVSKVNFQVSTTIFKESPAVTNFDLRGSFALIPSSSYLLDHIVDATSSIADSIVVPPVRPINDGRSRTLLDDAIDGYGIHVPLIEFHPIRSRCASAVNPAQDMSTDTNMVFDNEFQAQNIFDIRTPNVRTGPSPKNTFQLSTHKIFTTNKRLGTLEGHPHIVTRSHLRVVDFTKVLNFDRFNETFQQFRAKSCGQQLPGIKRVEPSWLLCPEESLRFGVNKLGKTSLLQLGIPGESGINRTEWAYAPYITTVEYASGPQDLVPIPVNRENCNQAYPYRDSTLSLPDEGMVNVTWSITYSGRTPAKMVVGDIIGKIPVNRGTDDEENLKQQYFAELIHGIYGHRHTEKAHPRRALVLIFLRDMFYTLAVSIPLLWYWHTRVTTAGISVPGTAFWMLSDIIACINGAKVAASSLDDHGAWSYCIFMIWAIGPFKVILNILRLKVIMRLQIQWRSLLLPIVKVLPSSHTERASTRIDAKLWRLRISALLFGTLVYVFKLIATGFPEWKKGTEGTSSRLLTIMFFFIGPIYLTGCIAQIALNFKRRTFASHYKTTAVSVMIWDVGSYLFYSPMFIGDVAVHPKLITLPDYIWTLVAAIYLYQALRYPSEEYKDGEE